MPKFIEAGVRELRESSRRDSVTLLVGYNGGRDEADSAISSIDGDVVNKVGKTTYRVEIPEMSVDSLCEFEGVISVELDADDVHTQESEDFLSQTGSMM